MKNVFSLVIVLAFATSIFAQHVPMSVFDDSPSNSGRSNEYVCAPGSVFSYTGADVTNAVFCQEGYTYYQCMDDYTASGPFSTMRFWGGDFTGCSLASAESFDIYIYDGNPSTTGQIVHSFTLDGVVTAIPVNFFSTDIYQIDIDFGMNINQLSGWIVISRNAASCASGFAWAGVTGGNSISYNGTDWVINGGDLFFCLGGEASIPISNWAIVIGLLLIGAFIVVRYRTRLA